VNISLCTLSKNRAKFLCFEGEIREKLSIIYPLLQRGVTCELSQLSIYKLSKKFLNRKKEGKLAL
jgi:hypothetical protein